MTDHIVPMTGIKTGAVMTVKATQTETAGGGTIGEEIEVDRLALLIVVGMMTTMTGNGHRGTIGGIVTGTTVIIRVDDGLEIVVIVIPDTQDGMMTIVASETEIVIQNAVRIGIGIVIGDCTLKS